MPAFVASKHVILSQVIDPEKIKAGDEEAQTELSLLRATVRSIRALLGDKEHLFHMEITNPSGEVLTEIMDEAGHNVLTGLSDDTRNLKNYERIYVSVPLKAVLKKAFNNKAGFLALPAEREEGKRNLIPYLAIYLAAIMIAYSDDLTDELAGVLDKLMGHDPSNSLSSEIYKKDIKTVQTLHDEKYYFDHRLIMLAVPVSVKAYLQAVLRSIAAVGSMA